MDILSKEKMELISRNPEIVQAMNELMKSGVEEAKVVLKDGRKIIVKKIIT